MKPLDSRLLAYAKGARGFILVTTALTVLSAACIVAQALLIAAIISPVITGEGGLDLHLALILTAVIGLRALLAGIQERFAHTSAATVIEQLRHSILLRATDLGPRWLATRGAGVTLLVTRALEDLTPYITRYLPQLLATALVTPATLIVMAYLDLLSAGIMAVVVPLIPLFMALIGRLTAEVSARRLTTMQTLGARVLDLIAGLPTLRAFRRAHGPEADVKALGESHQRATMGTLQVAFLSGAVLELLATLGVALVAVTIGFRLLAGQTTLFIALACIMLAPEVLNPLRAVGVQFHASTDGIAAAQAAFAVLDLPAPTPGVTPCPDLANTRIVFRDLSVQAGTADRFAPHCLNGVITPGRVTALVGPNGAGKSTAIAVLLGLQPPTSGGIDFAGPAGIITGSDIAPETLWRQVAWAGQRAVIEPGTVENFVRAGRNISRQELDHVAETVGLSDVITDWSMSIGQGGDGFSVGQRQRLVLARTLLSTAPLVILDEPTAHLDTDMAQVVALAIRQLRIQHRTVVLVAHREALISLADDILEVRAI